MKKLIAFGMVFGLMVGAAQAATISVQVATDKAQYLPGETINWTVYAWASQGDNRGVALLGIALGEDKGVPMNPAQTTGSGLFKSLAGSWANAMAGFILGSPGLSNPAGGLSEMLVYQADPSEAGRTLDAGIDDGQPPLLLYGKGSFSTSVVGIHHITPDITGANYFPDPSAAAKGFEVEALSGGQFEVIPEPATLLLTGMGLGLMGLIRRRRS